MTSTTRQLFFDGQRKKYYWYDSASDQLIYEDGLRQPRPASVPQSAYLVSTRGSPYQHCRHPAASQPYMPTTRSLGSRSPGYPSSIESSPGSQPSLKSVGTADDYAHNSSPATIGKSTRRQLQGGGDAVENLQRDYKVQSGRFFEVGRVFLILWAEPAGETRVSPGISQSISTGMYNEMIFSKVRRFVVIRSGQNYCSALPIVTYGHRGVGKPGIAKSEHAIVYSGRQAPPMLASEMPARGEDGMRGTPIRVIPDAAGDMLDSASRIDFGKVHTVQHNIKVKAFGTVHPMSIQALVLQFSNTWLPRSATQPSASVRAQVADVLTARASQAQLRDERLADPSSVKGDDDDDDDDDDDEEEDVDADENENEDEWQVTDAQKPSIAGGPKAEAATKSMIHRAYKTLVSRGITPEQAARHTIQYIEQLHHISRESATELVRTSLQTEQNLVGGGVD